MNTKIISDKQPHPLPPRPPVPTAADAVQAAGFRLMVRDLLHAADMDMGISLQDTEQRIVDAYEARMVPLLTRLLHSEQVMEECKRWMRRAAESAGIEPPQG